MSEEHQDVVTPAAKRPYKRRAVAKPPKQADEFAGITARDCCVDCNEKRCVITGMNVCGHPLKASHPGAEPKVIARIARAKKMLAHQKIEAA